MSLRLITAPAVTPIVLADVEAQVRASLTAESALIGSYIAAVTAKAEGILKRALVNQTWEYTLDMFPICDSRIGRYGSIKLPLSPVQSITSIKYTDGYGVLQTVDSSAYMLTSDDPVEVVPVYGASWPVARIQPDSIVIRYVCGYGAAGTNVPEAIRVWMLLNVANLYENRETVVIGAISSELHSIADPLLDQYKLVMF